MTSKIFLKRFNQTITVEGQNLITEFFITFSRFECALKESGFATGNGQHVNPNWDSFTQNISTSFENSEKNVTVKNAIEYLSNNPPRIQNLENGLLSWRGRIFQNNDPTINKLSLSIRDIRNNLFHGGKFNGNYEEDVSRNFILLKHSIVILNHWLNLNNNVKQNFLK